MSRLACTQQRVLQQSQSVSDWFKGRANHKEGVDAGGLIKQSKMSSALCGLPLVRFCSSLFEQHLNGSYRLFVQAPKTLHALSHGQKSQCNGLQLTWQCNTMSAQRAHHALGVLWE